MFDCDKENFITEFNNNTINMYITGTATKQMTQKEEFSGIAKLKSKYSKSDTKYLVVPLGKSMDIIKLEEFLEIKKGA